MDNTRRFYISAALAFLFTLTCNAQDVSLNAKDMPARFDESALQRIMPTRYGGRSRQWREEAMAEAERQSQHQDSLMLPPLNAQGQVDTTCRYPLAFGGWNSWGLHRGLNVQIGASVFAEFGKGAHSGAGFQQNIALMYAMPINDKLSVAVGGYLNNVNYAGGNWHDAGLSAVMGYRFNEHLEAYIWGQKSITNNVGNRFRYSMYDGYYGGYGFGGFSRNFYGFPSYSAYDLSGIGDRIGATLRYNFNNNMSIEVTVENRWMPSR
ncbi:hypothetical protein [uncultured Prevotella sp.]|uniref:hypothetical protein n=1 Tax=uncultured Prevotella sp. TaxID=159272 RepID=UPI0026DD951D|nr:hypothetical protein [uncultured Prevotella sp.]